MMWKHFAILCLLIVSFVVGKIIAKGTKEELKAGRKAFLALMILSLSIAIISLFLNLAREGKLLITISMLVIFIISAISWDEAKKLERENKFLKCYI